MDDESTKSSLYSSNARVEEYEEWYGHLPCVCRHSHEGCPRHNPMQSLVYRNSSLPPREQHLVLDHMGSFFHILSSIWHKSLDIFWNSPRNTSSPREAPTCLHEPLLKDDVLARNPEPSPFFYTELPFDSQSVDTLAPIHPTMPYHLAFYHLDCIRRRLDPDIRVAFIPELSCSGTSSFSPNGPSYTWSSEIYFRRGTFLQKQELHYIIGPESNLGFLKFTECPHIALKIWTPWFRNEGGFLVAHAWLSFNRIDGRETFGFKHWTSRLGRFARMSMCPQCHSDHEQVLELVGRQLHIRNTLYRDLGPAKDRSMPRWVSLLTGEGVKHRVRSFDLYARVWRTAKRLGRPNLHVVTHTWSRGEFVVGTI